MKADRLGKYRIIALLGQGGMASVFLSVVPGPLGVNKLLVVKLLRDELSQDEDFLAMFLNEARLAARLNHANVVQTYEIGLEDGHHFLAMDYLDGQPLHAILRKASRSGVPLDVHVRILAEMLAGLHYAHTLRDFDGTQLSVVHRDVSPQNVFVTYDGQVKLVDFGVAKTLAASHHTRPGALKGKLAYMAPEQLQPVPTDRRADLFAVGILLWEMLSGKRMWQGMNEVQIVSQLAAGLPFPALPSDIGLPAGLDAICERALQPNPDHRYRTAAEMEMDLDRVSIGAADSHARNLGRVVSLAFAGERAERQALIESSRHGVVTGELPQAPHARDVERPATPPRAMPSIDVTVSDLGLERPAAGDPSPVLAPPSARGRRVWLRRTAAFAGVLVIGVVLVRVDGGAKRLLVEAQPAPVAQPPAPAPASSVPPIPAAAPQPAAVVIADEALARDQPRSRRVHHRPSADEDATLPPTPAIAGVDLDDPPDRSAHRHGSALRP